MPSSRKRHSSSTRDGSKRVRNDSADNDDDDEKVAVAGNHKLRSRSQSVSYREPEDDEDDFLNDDESDNDDNANLANGLADDNQEEGSYTDNDNDDNGNDQSLARNVKIKIPRKFSNNKTIDDDEDEDGDVGTGNNENNDDDEDDEDEDDEEKILYNSRSTRTRGRLTRRLSSAARNADDDDEYVESEDEEAYHSEEDNYSDGSDYEKARAREEDRNFIVDDEEDGAKRTRNRRASRRSKSQRRSGRSRSRRLTRNKSSAVPSDSDESYKEDADDGIDDGIDENSLQEELEDLKATPEASPPRKNLRERNKNINYQLPPPLPDNSNIDDMLTSAPAAGFDISKQPARKIPKFSNGFNKGLFPVAGPFGGNDIVPIFGSNLRPEVNMSGNGMNLNDSSSSEDEFVTRPYDPALGTTIPANGSANGNVNNSSKAPQLLDNSGAKKKKNSMADSDPLGIDTSIDFTSVGGLDNYIDQLKEMVALPLLYPEVYAKFSITPPRGVLFHGPPGTGKTLMARALASSCSTKDRKITFFMRKGADCLSKWVGEAERQLRLLFEEAKNKQPSIIFFDEIDGLAPVRSSKQEQIHSSIVSTLLALMDGMDNRGQVIVIGATNRPDAIDPALRRPGRFDREFYFSLPDLNARTTILNIHTKKWHPALPESLINKLAALTKGYGGSDIRALCTEAALNSIKRRYPQIYDSSKKLLINPDEIKVSETDFMHALDKIVPSSARSTSNPSNPLPEHLEPLLKHNYDKIIKKLNQLVSRKNKDNLIDFDGDSSDEDESGNVEQQQFEETFGLSKHDLLKKFESSRVFKPRLLISGRPGMGQKYFGSAILNYLEGFQVQSLDLGTIFSESGRTPEATIIQMFLEARRNQPSILFIPTLEIWLRSVPESAKSTLEGLLRSLSSSERVLLLGLCEVDEDNEEDDELKYELARFFGLGNLNNFTIKIPDTKQREQFFKYLWAFLQTKPIFPELSDPKYQNYKKIKEAKKAEKLPVIAVDTDNATDEEKAKEADKLRHKELKQQYKNDVRLRNFVKIKLSTLMEFFKARYKRFKKPVIPLQQLAHLFEPALYNPEEPPQYTKDGDMILDTYTGKKYYNMELDTIEERLWNGYYSEPKQFLKDIEMIYLDAKTSDDRERSLKASELFVNAQVSIEEQFTAEILEQCKNMRKREIQKQKEYEAKIREIERKAITASTPVGAITEALAGESNVNGSGNTEEVGSSIDVEKNDAELNIAKEEKQAVIENGKAADKYADGLNSDGIKDIVQEDVQMRESVTSSAHDKEENEITAAELDGEQQPKIDQENKEKDSKGDKGIESNIKKPKETLFEKFSEEDFVQYEEFVKEQERNKNRSVELDEKHFEQTKNKLISSTENFTIENLELVNSLISEVIWQNRNKWNRNEVLKLIDKKIDYAVKVIGKSAKH